MASQYLFSFHGGVMQPSAGSTVKFLLFFVHGGKEISLADARRNDLVDTPTVESIVQYSGHSYVTELNVVKVFLMESIVWQQQKLVQSFYLSLGTGSMDRQEVTIAPRDVVARARNYQFVADARFLKRSEALNLLDPESTSHKILCSQRQLSTGTLREIVSIKRFGIPQETVSGTQGTMRMLRI